MLDRQAHARRTGHFDALIRELAAHQERNSRQATAQQPRRLLLPSTGRRLAKAMASHDAVAELARRARRTIDGAVAAGTMSRQQAATFHKRVDALALHEHHRVAAAGRGDMRKAVWADWNFLPAADDRAMHKAKGTTSSQIVRATAAPRSLADWSQFAPAHGEQGVA